MTFTVLGRLLIPPRAAAPERVQVCVAVASPAAREGVRFFLSAAPDLAVTVLGDGSGEPVSGGAVVETVRQTLPRVLVLDAAVEAPDVFETLARLRAEAPGVRSVVFGGSEGPEFLRRALAFGAAGHLGAESDASVYRDAVRAAARGTLAASAALRDVLAHDPHGTPTQAAALTPREFQMLRALAGGGTTRSVAEALSVTESTVRSTKSRIRTKLGLATDAALVRYAVERGLV